ncbi:MAG TPA: tetratricopeptide repeat protein [Acetobacteraceae bacterium]
MTETAFNEALHHHEAGRIAAAQAMYRGILADDPDHAGSLHLLGLIATEQGDPASGAALIQRAMRLAPGQAPHHNNLALAYRMLGRPEDAVHEYRAAAALRPGSAEIHNNLATALHDLGRHAEAVAHYRQAASCAPGVAEIWYNLANALAEQEKQADVAACFRQAIALKPDFANAHANYGRWLTTQGSWAEAAEHLAEATRLAPEHAPTWNNRGIALQELDRSQEAEACYRQALSLASGFADAHYNLGCLLLGQGRTEEAMQCQEAAIAADPQCGAAHLGLCMAQLPILYRSEAEIAERRRRYAAALKDLATAAAAPGAAQSLAAAIGAAQPFFLAYQGKNDRVLQATYGRIACRVLARTEPPAPLADPPAPGERIRLGIVSGFFCRHTVFRLFLHGWLSELDRDRFEVIGFHTGHTVDAETELAAGACDRFVRGLGTATAWRDAVIAARLAAQRLAPVQCVTWGHPDTTGMPTIDYFLSSTLMEPPNCQSHYTEQLIRLPNLGLCWLPETSTAAPLDRAALGLDPEAPVYWSGQSLYKYLPQYDAVFPRIAAAVGRCQFVFIAFAKSRAITAAFRDRLYWTFDAAGLDASQYCVILPPLSPEQFVAGAGLADVVLDPPEWSGGRSTLECLAQDPAIVTLPGRFMRGRHTAAILRRIGCEATIAGSLDEYVEIAARLGRDRAWREDVRQQVARGKAQAFHDVTYLRALEDFLASAAHQRVAENARAR